MSRKYTLEEVEYIRTKANVTYDEVIALLDAYEGDVVRVMAELERAGKLHSKSSSEKSFGVTLKALLRKGYENRMVVRKGDRTIANFSIIFMLVALCFAFHLTIPALLFAVLFGYKINFRKEEGAAKDFSDIIYTTKGSGVGKTSLEVIAPRIRRIRRTRLNRLNSHRIRPQPHTGNEQQGQDQGQTQGTQPRTADVQQGQAQCKLKTCNHILLTSNRSRHRYRSKTRNRILLTSNRNRRRYRIPSHTHLHSQHRNLRRSPSHSPSHRAKHQTLTSMRDLTRMMIS